jgi:hypothetical protein
MSVYQHHVLAIPPRRHEVIAERLKETSSAAVAHNGGRLFGIWNRYSVSASII